MVSALDGFVQQSRQQGMNLVDIRTLLLLAGWKDKQILAAFRSSESALAIPEPPASGTAREACLHLLAFTALYAWVIALVLLLFNLIEMRWPDPEALGEAEWRQRQLSSIRAQLATIVVAFPAFVILWRLLQREILRQPEMARNAVRRWLTYASTFVGSVTLASNTITLIYFLLEGEASLRFLLKVTTLFVISGGGLLYLRSAMRTPEAAS